MQGECDVNVIVSGQIDTPKMLPASTSGPSGGPGVSEASLFAVRATSAIAAAMALSVAILSDEPMRRAFVPERLPVVVRYAVSATNAPTAVAASQPSDPRLPDVRQVLAALLAEPIEDGVSHPAERVVAEFAKTHGAPAMVRALNQLTTERVGADFLRILARSAPLDPVTRAEIVRIALEANEIELRDAGVQAAESWGDPALAEVLRAHVEPSAWLNTYARQVAKDLEA